MDCEIGEIDHRMVQQWVGLMAADLKPETVGRYFRLLKKILASALAARYIDQNPCDGISLPKARKDEMEFLTREELEAGIEWTLQNRPRYTALLATLGYCGLRIGEAKKLEVGDIDRRSELPILRVRASKTDAGVVNKYAHASQADVISMMRGLKSS